MKSRARRRPLPRVRANGGFGVFYGPTVVDGVTGFQFPGQFAITQRGVIVDRRWVRGGRDRPDTYVILTFLLFRSILSIGGDHAQIRVNRTAVLAQGSEVRRSERMLGMDRFALLEGIRILPKTQQQNTG